MIAHDTSVISAAVKYTNALVTVDQQIRDVTHNKL